jgi:hypothetical protein
VAQQTLPPYHLNSWKPEGKSNPKTKPHQSGPIDKPMFSIGKKLMVLDLEYLQKNTYLWLDLDVAKRDVEIVLGNIRKQKIPLNN